MEPLELAFNWRIPSRDLGTRFARSGGPGGQNVNKVATKVELRLALELTESLNEGQKARLRTMYPSAVTRTGEFIVVSDVHRSQLMNIEDARQRLKEMILKNRRAPAIRRPTKPSRGAKKRRVADKRHRASIKAGRGRPVE